MRHVGFLAIAKCIFRFYFIWHPVGRNIILILVPTWISKDLRCKHVFSYGGCFDMFPIELTNSQWVVFHVTCKYIYGMHVPEHDKMIQHYSTITDTHHVIHKYIHILLILCIYIYIYLSLALFGANLISTGTIFGDRPPVFPGLAGDELSTRKELEQKIEAPLDLVSKKHPFARFARCFWRHP